MAKKSRNKKSGLSNKEKIRLQLKKEAEKEIEQLGLNPDAEIIDLKDTSFEEDEVETFDEFHGETSPIPFSTEPQKENKGMIAKIKRGFSGENKELKKLEKQADKIIQMEDKYKAMSDEELAHQTVIFKERIQKGESLDDLLVEAFATVREAAYRQLGLKAFKVQLMGGIALHNGDIAEMKTGEGKTLTSIFPVYLNALSGKGAHVVTVNEYLAKRDAEDNGKVFGALGLSVGLNLQSSDEVSKRNAHACDVTYTTHSELGFDYLRDNMVYNAADRVLRPLNFALLDEVDSTLIDEARTPLIISGGKGNLASTYRKADKFVKSLKADKDFEVDIESKTVSLTEYGIGKAEKEFHIQNLYDVDNIELVHRINQALKANYTMENNVDYIIATEDGSKDIRNATIMIIDQFTGRVMPGREFSDGLHQALEAKEGVPIKEETITRATITYQNFFRLFNKLAGMTGTAKTEEEEFLQIYNMRVIEIPTNKPVIREDKKDIVYATKEQKYNAIIKEVQRRHAYGQPILLGTVSIETSELLSKRLNKVGIKHNVLNAKNHAKEAAIIANAGQKGAVTIATNMAGRGTDIKLGKGVPEIGGLCVIGSERHESRRIDNQLRGRSGRQGDPGCSLFFVSIEDDLILRFANEKIKKFADKHITDGQPMESKSVTKAIENSQKRVENQNFESRKNILKYDDVMREHREMFYNERNIVIDSTSIDDIIKNLFKRAAINEYDKMCDKKDKIDITKYFENINKNYILNATVNVKEETFPQSKEVLTTVAGNIAFNQFLSRFNPELSQQVKEQYEKSVVLSVFDNAWTKHISAMDRLKNGMYLRSYAQKDPINEYTEEAYFMFENMSRDTTDEICKTLIHMGIRKQDREEIEPLIPKVTLDIAYSQKENN